MAQFGLKKAEEVEWTGALGKKIHGFVVKPPNFDASKKYPLVVLIHGGPQSAWNDSWSYRWNPQILANDGYIVFAPEPARLDRLRSAVCKRDKRRLGRQSRTPTS